MSNKPYTKQAQLKIVKIFGTLHTYIKPAKASSQAGTPATD